ncbi:MAG: tyrosine-type recombinase/integrase [Candidatus Paceibacterota bacterium]
MASNANTQITELKAYDLLAAQPITAQGLSNQERSGIVVSAVSDIQGNDHVLSFYGDAVWDLRPFFEQSNLSDSAKYIYWPEDCPQELVNDCKAVLYAYFKRGRTGFKPPVALIICQLGIVSAIPFMRWLASHNIKRFDHVRPIHVANYIHLTKSELTNVRSVYAKLRILDLLWALRSEAIFPLSTCPWGDSTLFHICGLSKLTKDRTECGKTLIIPPEVQAKIFNFCESVIGHAPRLLLERDWKEWGPRNKNLVRIRDASLYILCITSGMRNDEAIGVEVGSWRSEVRDGVEYNWVGTNEHKTGKGFVEFLVPKLTIEVLELMSVYVKPLQEKLSLEIEELESNLKHRDKIQQSIRLKKAKKDVKKLFLCTSASKLSQSTNYRIDALSSAASKISFRRLAIAAGTQWPLAPHQCRKTYARNFVESRMGRASLIFLKWQFKHSSMSMTQLYASNPMQDATLFDEILDEMTEFKVDLIESWLGDQPLSGGAGRAIKKSRVLALKNKTALLTETAEHVHIRATGHGWCLAQERGCGGAGIYEATRCVDCKHSVIDNEFTEIWKGIYEQQNELLSINDAGPAVQQRVFRDIELARKVMKDLGIPFTE